MKNNLKNILIDLFLISLMSIFTVFISFLFTNQEISKNLFFLYIDNKNIVALNFLPIFILNLVLYFASGRIFLTAIFNFVIFISMGLANISKLHYRYENIRFSDLKLFGEAMTMLKDDYSIILPRFFGLIIISSLALIVFLFIFRKYKMPKKFRLVGLLFSIIILFASKNILLSQKLYADNRVYGFNDFVEVEQEKARGMVYAFVHSLNEIITTKPDGYNEKSTREVWTSYDDSDIPSDEKINIIGIMLESYSDFSEFNIDFSKDPYKSFREIKENSIQGRLINNMFGGGTAFVERSFLLGSSYYSRYYRPVNSYVWYLKSQGYKTMAMHPHNGGFYNRRNVNPKLGFDNFLYMENYFKDYEKGGKHFTDENLREHIIKDYKKQTQDGSPYFSFTVTMQNHGPYESSKSSEEYIPKENFSTEESYNIVNNYFTGIKSSGDSLKKLLDDVNDFESPTLVIVFGDHKPFLGQDDIGYKDLGIDISADKKEGYLNRCSTPYILWANESLKKSLNKDFLGEGPEISSQLLMNYAFKELGWSGPKYMQIIQKRTAWSKCFQ
ncbi:LTA synthase family protein [Peptoniphilus timonensis]|uniref:LTA synthase family protein n=1 Tax=Peptoniphilus timonensis TaxID=1268254 RepID=UPI0002E0A4A1|nr:alkaline phosphatase family protein [Peptoniphilus timonensis]